LVLIWLWNTKQTKLLLKLWLQTWCKDSDTLQTRNTTSISLFIDTWHPHKSSISGWKTNSQPSA
jgi:hypothetical protein